MIAASASVLGVLGGFLIAHRVEDETGWYPRWFLGFGILGLVSVFTAAFIASPGALSALHLVLLGIALYAFSQAKPMLLFGALAVELAWASSLLAAELALVALIPVAGWLYARGVRRGFLWSLAIPTVITVSALL